MGTERDFLGKQFRKDSAIDVIVDLGANGLVAAGITCKFSKNGGAFASLVATTQFTLTGLGENQYLLRILAAVNDTAGLATIWADNTGVQTDIKSLFIEDGAKTSGQIYSGLSAASLKVQLQQASVDLITSDILEEPNAGHTTAGTVGNSIRNLKTTWNDPTAAAVATSVWDKDISAVAGATKAGNILYNLVSSVWAAGSRTLTSLGISTISAIWNFAGAITAGIGKTISDNLNAPVGTVDTVVDAIKLQTDKMQFDGSNNIKSTPQTQLTISAANLAAIADAMCDESLAGHLTAGTVGKALQMARSNALGKWEVVNVTANSFQLKVYDVDNTTLLDTFTVTLDANGKPTKRTT